MAELYGANRTKMNSPTGSNILDQGINKSNICYMFDSYEAVAAATGDIIFMGDLLPDGAVVTRITLLADDLGGTATIDIGDVLDPDRYSGTTVDISGAATTYVYPEQTAGIDVDAYGYQVVDTGVTSTSSNQIQITVLTSAITGTIRMGIEYAI